MTAPWPEFVLDAASWETRDAFYEAFFAAVGAPNWHGRNLNALRDSIGGGDINETEVPYRIRITGCQRAKGEARQAIESFAEVVADLRDEGVEVELTLED